jgi:hypothetical protein
MRNYSKYASYVRFDVFAAVTMKNAVFWYTGTHFVHHKKYFMSPLQN